MQTLREFFTSSSGLAPARQGLGLGWVISALTGVAILLGAKEAKADDECEYRTYEDCSWNAWCFAKTLGQKPIRCCEITEYPDCSFDRGSCYCTHP